MRRRYMQRLSNEQQKFLRGVVDGSLSTAELKERQGIERGQVGRWLGNRCFRIELRRAIRESHAQLVLETTQLARVAAEIVGTMMRSKEPVDPRAAEVCLLMMIMAADVRHGSRERKRKSGVTKKYVRDLVHPSVKHREDELIRVLLEK